MEGNSEKDNNAIDSDSDGSSSSGDGYESPAMSDFEGNDEEIADATKRKRKDNSGGLFEFRAQKFHKQEENGSSKLPTPSTGRKSAAKNKTIKEKLLRLNRKKAARIQKKVVKQDDSIDYSDDDSDLEFVSDGNGKKKSEGNKEIIIDSKKDIPKDTAFIKGPIHSSDRSRKKPQRSVANTKPIILLSSGDSSPDSMQIASKTKGILATSTTAATRRPFSTTTTATKVIDCLSSDDDSDVENDTGISLIRPVKLPPKIAESLRQARIAKERLEQAQEYHAHDVHVAVQETVYIPTNQDAARRAKKAKTLAFARNNRCPSSNSAMGMGMGKALSFTCRCGHILIDGTKEPTVKDKQSTVLIVREKEALSALVERFCRTHSLPHEKAEITLTFDGRKLDTTKTPTFYEMEHEDLIDVSVSAPHRLTAAELQQATRAIPSTLFPKTATKSLQFTCRVQIKVAAKNTPWQKLQGRCPNIQQQAQTSKPEMVTKTIGLRENEHLGTLAKRLCVILGDLPPATTKVEMRFDGRVLDTEKLPGFYEMEDEDMIEVSIEKQEQPTANGNNPLSLQQDPPPIGDNTRIVLKLFQQKGKTYKGPTTLSLKPQEPLSKLMDDYKIKLMASSNNNTRRRTGRNESNIDSTQLQFRFQGKFLDLTKIPGDYKIAALDRIDVIDVTSVAAVPAAARSRTTRSSSRKNNKKTVQV